MYDLAVVTQSKITYEIVKELIRTVPNLAGIKSADMNMFRKLKLDPEVPEDFLMVYSGLDNFDIAYKWGIDKCLDGMPACTPVNSGKLFTAMKNGDYDKAAEYLNNIIALRDLFVARDLWPSFSTAMNLLGYEGNFAPDYVSPIKEEYIEEIKNELARIGEL
jgi:dihydrodipicolinate synthase/N-acetylneuraminate lyase